MEKFLIYIFYKVSDLIPNVYQENDLVLYKKHLIKNGITENNEVINYESSIPLEYNIVHMNGGNLYNLPYLSPPYS